MKSLERKFTLSKEVYELPKDVEVDMFIAIERVEDYEAKICILTQHPEECFVALYSMRSLPPKIEENLGMVRSIQGQTRDRWIYPMKFKPEPQ